MRWPLAEIPVPFEWIGLLATVIGSALALWAAFAATGAK